MIEQTTVMIENRIGRLKDVLTVLSNEKVDLNGISIADSADFGVLRMILSDPARGMQALEKAGFIVKKTQVLAVEVPDKPGALQNVFGVLAANHINIQYVYAFGTKLSGHAMIVVKADENKRAEDLLLSCGCTSLSVMDVNKRLKI